MNKLGILEKMATKDCSGKSRDRNVLLQWRQNGIAREFFFLGKQKGPSAQRNRAPDGGSTEGH